MITIIPRNGLGNRIRSIRAAVRLANKQKTGIKIVWMNNSVCPCDFTDIFSEIRGAQYGLTVRNIRTKKHPFFHKLLFSRKAGSLLYDIALYDPPCQDPAWMAKLPRCRRVLINTCEEFFHSQDPVEFVFCPQITKQANRVLGNRSCVGIHIRQDDNREAIQNSPLPLFFDTMENIAKDCPDTFFYISTDDRAVLGQILQKYPDRCLYYQNKSWERGQKDGQLSAAVDMLCLSKTKIIYGSYWSSFSEEASKIGNIQKIVLKSREGM